MPQEHKIVNGRLVLTGAQQSSDLVPAVRQQPAKPPAAKPRSKPKPKPKGFFEKLSNDIRYELFNRPRPANPLQRYVGGLSRAVASSPLQGVGLGVAGVGDNAMRVGYSYAQRASGRPKADASSGRFGGHLDQTVDRVYTALGAKPPSQMTQDERSGDQFRRSVALNVMLAPVTPGFGVARATTALGAAVRGGAAFAVNEALSTYLDDNTGGNIVNLINETTGLKLPGAVDVGKADMLDAANQSLVPNAAFGVALGAAVGSTVALGAAAFRNIRRNTRATRAVQQETRQRAKQEAMGLLEKDEADGLDFTPQAMEPPAPAPREPSFQEANAAMEQRLGMPSNAARPEPAAAPTNVAPPEPKPIPSAELQDPTNPGADMGAIYEPRQERPWDYDPELPESTALGKGIEELSDSELQIVLNSPGSPVVERVNQTLEARAQVQAPPPMDAGMVMAPADRLADDYLPSVMRKLGGREDYELRPLFDAEANPQLWQKAQALTGVDDPGQLSKADMLDTFGAMAAEGRVPIVNRMMGAQMLPTGEVQAAPLVFQYKGGVNEAGEQIGNSLSGVERWDPSAEGIIQVWRDAGGEIGDPGMVYVVNGHNRLAAAKRLGIPSMRVEYLDAPTAAEARLQGAISNVSDGKGTVFDAAKLAREYDIKDPAQLKALGKPGASGFWKDGIAVGRLPEDVFTAAVNEQIPLRRAVIIGESGVDEETMRSAYRYLVQQGPDNVKEGTLREMLAMSKSSPASSSADQPDILSGTEWAQNFNAGMLAKAEVAGAVRLLLSKEKKLFGTVGRQAGQIERVGQVDATAAKDISGEASRALAIFDDLKYQTGPVGDLLNEGTQRVLAGEQAAQVAKGIKNRLAASIQEAMGKEVAPATDVVQEDMFAVAGRQADETSQPVELTAEQRDAAEARLLQEAIAGGEVRPPNAPIPELPAPAQVRLDELDPNEPITPGSRAAQALADETRLALEHARADAALQELQEKAVKDANDYELLTFEEKKELGLTADLGKAITPEVLPAPGVRLDSNANPAQTARRLGGHNRGRGRWGITEQQWLDTFKRLGGVPDWFDLAGGSANWDKLMQGYELPQIEAKIKALVRDDSAIQTAAAAPRSATPQGVPLIDIPSTAFRAITAKTDEGRIQSAARSLMGWARTPLQDQMPMEQALQLVRAKGAILDPDAIPGLDMDKVREDSLKGRPWPEVKAAFEQFYGVQQTAAAAPRSATPLADAIEGQMREMAQSDARLYRRTGQAMANIRQGLDELAPAPVRPAPVRLALSASQPELLLPQDLRQASPRYGRNTITFQSDLDRTAYVLANDAIKPSKSAAKFRQVVKEAGLNLDEVVAHGQTVRAALKQAAKGNPGQIELPAQPWRERGSGSAQRLAQRGGSQPSRADDLLAQAAAMRAELYPKDRIPELISAWRKVVGDEVRIRVLDTYKIAPQSEQWGGDGSQLADIAGAYEQWKDTMTIWQKLSPIMEGIPIRMTFSDLLHNGFHEAFHRIVRMAMPDKDLAVLNTPMARFKAALAMDEMGAERSTIAYDELLTEAAAKVFVARSRNIDPVSAILDGFFKVNDSGKAIPPRVRGAITQIAGALNKAYDFIEKTVNLFQGRGFESISTVFQKAASGQMRNAEPAYKVWRDGSSNVYGQHRSFKVGIWEDFSWDGKPVSSLPKGLEMSLSDLRSQQIFDAPPTKVSQQRLQRQIDDLDQQIIDNRRKAEQEGC